MATPSGMYSTSSRSFGEWRFPSGRLKPETIAGIPLSASAATIGIEPPARSSSGRVPTVRSKASCPSRIAAESGGIRPGRELDSTLDLDLGAFRRRLAEQTLEDRGDLVGLLPGREPDRDVRLAHDRDHRLLEVRRPAGEAVDVDRRLGPGADVELVGRGRVRRSGALAGKLLRARHLAAPVGELLLGRRGDAGTEGLGHPAVTGHHARQGLHQRVHAVQRGASVGPGVEVALARAYLDVEVAQAPRGDVEGRPVARRHLGVEDHARIRTTLVLREPVDDRVPADLLLAVTGDADVHGQPALGGE